MKASVAVLVIYLLMLAALAYWSRRETRTLSGYFLAGRKLPYWTVAFSTNATGESGWLLLGLTGMGYAVGAQALWIAVGEVIGIWLSWTLVSTRLKRLADETDAITLPDVLAARFNDRRHVLRSIAVIIILTMVAAYVTAQLVATGKAFNTFMGIDYQTAIIVGAVVIVGYTFVGGFKAVAYTDVVQGVLMLTGLIAIPIVATQTAGGWSQVVARLGETDPGLLSIWGTQESGIVTWIAIASFLAIGLPFLGVPQLMTRYMAIRDVGELKTARTISVAVILLFDIGAVTAGMAGRALYPDLADAETILPLLAQNLFPPLITGVIMIMVLSAIMSTVDSLLLLASSAVVRDGMQQIGGSPRSDAELAKWGKLVTVIIGVIAVAFALREVPVIFWFILFAWSGLGAAFGPVILCALYYKKTTLAGAVAGMLGGFLTSIVWVLAIKSQTHGLYEMIPGFVVGLVLTLLVSRLTQKPR